MKIAYKQVLNTQLRKPCTMPRGKKTQTDSIDATLHLIALLFNFDFGSFSFIKLSLNFFSIANISSSVLNT